MDLPKRELRNMTGRKTMCGVLEAYVVFILIFVIFMFDYFKKPIKNLSNFLWVLSQVVYTILHTHQLPIGAGHCQWGGHTDRNVCNIHGEVHLASRYRAMLRSGTKNQVHRSISGSRRGGYT